MNPRYPIYIPSKGRWESRLTSKALEAKRVPYRIVVEPSEFDCYAAQIDPAKIIILPSDFSKLGNGSIPVRNFIWDHALSEGHAKHWIIDDNIVNFYRLNLNRRIPVDSGTIFRCAEDFTDRYENIAFSGFNNIAFAPDRNDRIPPFTTNTRIYSITLINSSVPYRWRGRYNEDTDICLRALKDGWVTVQFNAFLADKATTMKMKGGNTDTIYNTGDNRKEFAESLARQHPDVASVVWKFNRWHHQVDYSRFKGNKLKRKSRVVIPAGVNDYGMKLIRVKDSALPLTKITT
jgi:hypothetical protein